MIATARLIENNLIALDADTGKEIWKNTINAQLKVWQRCRGMAYLDATAAVVKPENSPVTPEATTAPAVNCQRRLLTNTIDAWLIAVDADTGESAGVLATTARLISRPVGVISPTATISCPPHR